jgi:hypothetical protein
MGLAISVGQLAFLRQDEYPEDVEMFRAELRAVNRVLAANGLPPHVEPESLPTIVDRVPVGSMPYGWLHHTRRAVAYAMRPGRPFRPLDEDEDPGEDPLYDAVLSTSTSHVICHSDCEGFYVPTDFPEPLYDELRDGEPGALVGGMLGSSQGGLRELALAAPLLDIPLEGGRLSDKQARAVCEERQDAHPHWIARQAWLCLYERLRQSVEFRTLVVFG